MYYKGTKTTNFWNQFPKDFYFIFLFSVRLASDYFRFPVLSTADRNHRFFSEAFPSFIGHSFSWIFLCVYLPRMLWTTVDVWTTAETFSVDNLCQCSLVQSGLYTGMESRGGESARYWVWSNLKYCIVTLLMRTELFASMNV